MYSYHFQLDLNNQFFQKIQVKHQVEHYHVDLILMENLKINQKKQNSFF
jgi:hypothetical protein